MPKIINFPKDFWEDTQNELRFIPGKNIPDSIPVTAVKCVTLRGNKIMLTKVPRGWDIPTGRVEDGETPDEAIKREVFEEVGSTLIRYQLIGYLKSIKLKENEKNIMYPKISAIAVFKSNNFAVKRHYKFQHEATERKFVTLQKNGSISAMNWSPMMKAIFNYASGKI